MSKIEYDEESQKEWNEVYKLRQEGINNGGMLYFKDKNQFSQLVTLLSQMEKNLSEDFFEKRMLVIGECTPLESENGEPYNIWESKYSPVGSNGNDAFLTTDEKGHLLHLVGLGISEVIGSSDKLIELLESGEDKYTEQEQKYLYHEHEEVGYVRPKKKDLIL